MCCSTAALQHCLGCMTRGAAQSRQAPTWAANILSDSLQLENCRSYKYFFATNIFPMTICSVIKAHAAHLHVVLVLAGAGLGGLGAGPGERRPVAELHSAPVVAGALRVVLHRGREVAREQGGLV